MDSSPAIEYLMARSADGQLQVSLTPGTRVAQYEVQALIGAGGMGEVYRAHDARLGRDIALKVLPAHLSRDPEMRARFEHEARAIAALSHENVMAIHELAIINGEPIAVVELLEGESLRMRLARGPMERTALGGETPWPPG